MLFLVVYILFTLIKKGTLEISFLKVPFCQQSDDIYDMAFYDCSYLKSIIISNSVTSIGKNAFEYCRNLSSINMGSITTIEDDAFYGCNSLKSIEIPSYVKKIGNNVFNECYRLIEVINKSSLNIKKGSSDYGDVAYYALNVKNDGTSDIDKIEDYVFYKYKGINYLIGYEGDESSLVLPKDYKGEPYEIYHNSFKDRGDITSIIIPAKVTNIGDSSFKNCSGLTNISVDDNNTIYDSRNNCNAIIESASNKLIVGCQNTIIPDDVTNIGDYAFNGCNLTTLRIPDSIISIGEYAFPYSLQYNEYDNAYYLGNENNPYLVLIRAKSDEVESCTINEKCKIIYNDAFNGCFSLKKLVIGNNVTSIGNWAFDGCSVLTNIIIPNSVINIGNSAFSGCSGLTTVIIGNNVTSIGNWAFEGCSVLTNIIIPNSVINIGDSAFRDCSGLTTVIIGNNVTSIGNSAFSGCSGLTDITISNSITSIGNYAFEGCSLLTNINFTGTLSEWLELKVVSEIMGKIHSNKTLTINGEKIKGKLEIPNNVTNIVDCAFYGCSDITSVIIPNSIINIGDFVFFGCDNLISVILSNGVKEIGESTFSDCINLSDIYYFGNINEFDLDELWFDIIPDIYYYSETQPTDTNNRYWHYVDDVPTLWDENN